MTHIAGVIVSEFQRVTNFLPLLEWTLCFDFERSRTGTFGTVGLCAPSLIKMSQVGPLPGYLEQSRDVSPITSIWQLSN